MRSAAQLLLGVFAPFAFAISTADAATVSGIVTGLDGAAVRGAFVQARNAKTKIMVSVLSFACRVRRIPHC